MTLASFLIGRDILCKRMSGLGRTSIESEGAGRIGRGGAAAWRGEQHLRCEFGGHDRHREQQLRKG